MKISQQNMIVILGFALFAIVILLSLLSIRMKENTPICIDMENFNASIRRMYNNCGGGLLSLAISPYNNELSVFNSGETKCNFKSDADCLYIPLEECLR